MTIFQRNRLIILGRNMRPRSAKEVATYGIIPNELLQLKNLRVLCLNSTAPVENLDFLKYFPNLIDFRFVNTNVLDGNLQPILDHPTIRTVGFLNKKHYNYKDDKIDSELQNKSQEEYRTAAYEGVYFTERYDYE